MAQNNEQVAGQNLEEKEVLDLSLTVGELLEAHPKLKDAMDEFGLEAQDIDTSSTVPELLKGMDVDPSLVATALQSMGYEVTGFTPEANPYAAQIGSVIDALFNNDEERTSVASADPMMANIEAAVRRAEKNGVLPTPKHGQNKSK